MTAKKLVFVLNDFNTGAVPNILLDIIPHIKKRGYHIKILSLQAINESEKVVKKCRKNNIKLETLNLSRNNIIKSRIKLKKYLKKENPNIIHSHLGRSDVFSALCKPKGSKLITTFHNIRNNYNKFTLLGYLLTDGLVDFRTSVSQTVEKTWYDEWWLKSNHCTVYNPIDLERIKNVSYDRKLREEFNIKKDDIFLLNVGMLIKQKGQIYLIKAMQKVINKNPNIKLVIAGKGKLKGNLEKAIKELGLQDNIILAGFRNDIPKLLKTADIFISPSLYEGHPIAILEAMTAKTPIIASTADGIKEVIDDRQDGLLVKYNNVSELSNVIIELINDIKLREKLSNNAYKKVVNLFSAEKIAKQYTELYEKI